MNMRVVLILGAIVGVLVSSAVLVLMWFDVSGVLNVGRTDLMYLFWPSSALLVGGWRTTIPGITITVSAVAINCLLYMAVAYGLYRIVLAVNNSVRS